MKGDGEKVEMQITGLMNDPSIGPDGHKVGCLSNERVSQHRTPIDCVTAKDLWAAQDVLKERLKAKKRKIRKLCARLYVLERQRDRGEM